ncbi:molybdopterin oxidoreductase family protein [Massilia orientalis]|uniref:Molybdopterin oxidoreductase family protein n=1 Tax=Massilia orientalis TaxID=3050128 RepID=A0ACC7MJA9_9BURK|nr:nitrate reductase [Massilia sp. YIM B02787]
MESRDSIADIWGERTPYSGQDAWPVRVDQRTTEAPERWVQSACVLCSNGCGCDIAVKDGRIVGVRGRAQDVVNRGRLGPKGLHGWEANNSPDRLTHPLVRRNGKLERASWDEAMALIVEQTQRVKREYSAGAIGFYTSGQLFIEEYYTLGIIGKAGLGTPHMDGNTRLCTATAAAALKESFGSDGQPGSYFDVDTTDCILMVGHNMSNTDTVLWMRVLDRRRHADPPKLIVIDPRTTMTAREADLHLAPKVGTNVAVLNGVLHLLIQGGHVDRAFIDRHTMGFDDLAQLVAAYPPERVEAISGVPAADLRRAADLIGSSSKLLSTCLQGVYQSNQATAAAVQINNINLVLGRIGRPGCGILQMNGQPTSQNTRETGADGDLPAFRNWNNIAHIEDLARVWNVDPAIIPHWTPPTHAMQIFRYCETGSIRMLWIQATNPAVSLPNLNRVRAILQKEGLFVVVQDAFLTETAQMADVVLPAALWGEKTGTFTNVDRTVHISHKAVEPPGEARSDFDIFVDFARRMDFKDKDGAPLIKWTTPEQAFEDWKACTRGRPCDYTGLSYDKLTGGSGIPWPCNSEHPDGEHYIYKDLVFPTDADYCESFGHDIITGAPVPEKEYRAHNPAGRAVLKGAEYMPPFEEPDADYPLFLTTGRLVYHFHTRTKTGRAPALANAAPDDFVQIAREDAEKLGIVDGDWVRVTSRRGNAEARAKIGDIGPGEVFISFHYGYWDEPGRARAANELTIYEWDPVSKQPHYKYAAVRIEKVDAPTTAQPERMDPAQPGVASPTAQESGVIHALKEAKDVLVEGWEKAKPVRAHVADYLGLLQASERRLVKAFEQTRTTHPDEPDIGPLCHLFERWSGAAADALDPFVAQYGERREGEPERLDEALVVQRKQGGFDMLRDLHDLWLLVNESMISLDVLEQAARSLHDKAFEAAIRQIRQQNKRQLEWLHGRIRQAAPQTLVVPS